MGYTPIPHFDQVLLAHGILASLAWVIIFPFGATLIRHLAHNSFRAHVGVQIGGMVIFIASVVLGAWLATKAHIWVTFNGHAIIGMIIFFVALLLPVIGTIHHRLFKSYRMTTIWAFVHVWTGRVIITVAMINGALGIQLTKVYHGNSYTKGEIIYGVIAGLAWCVYVVMQVRHAYHRGGDVKVGRKFELDKQDGMTITERERKESAPSTNSSSQGVAAWVLQHMDEKKLEAESGHSHSNVV